MQAAQDNVHMENALGLIKQISMSREERELADAVAKARGEEIAQFHAGYDVGKDVGYDLGKDDGYNIGKDEARREFAEKMIMKNKPEEEISELTGFSLEYIRDLRVNVKS